VSPQPFKGDSVMESRMIRMKQLIEYTALSRAFIFEAVKAGEFPKPHALSQGIKAWERSEVDAWIDERIKISQSGKMPKHHKAK
jgi:prophage regulatory protein